MGKSSLFAFTFYFLISLVASQNSDIKNRTLNYKHDGNIYIIEEKMNHINVTIKKNIKCKEEPCDFPIINLIEIKKERDYQNLKLVLDEIFNRTKIMEKSVVAEDLSDKQNEKIFSVFINNNITSKLEYKIINDLDSYHYKYLKRGYIYEKIGWHCYTICAGCKPSSGYSINIPKVEINGYSAIVYVKEGSPRGGVCAVLTYPIVKIKFNKKPTNITIINYANGQEYNKINLINY